jgi:hypothetical protein
MPMVFQLQKSNVKGVVVLYIANHDPIVNGDVIFEFNMTTHDCKFGTLYRHSIEQIHS